ncbi:MAG: BC1872 family protein [Planctomycetota bacterium]
MSTSRERKQMEAGAELDRLVCEEVMGREVRYIASEEFFCEENEKAPLGFFCNFGGAVFTSDQEWLIDGWLDVGANREVACYSTEISVAWEVAARMYEIVGHFKVGRNRNVKGGQWFVQIDEGECFGCFSKSAPLAICRAALVAVAAVKGEDNGDRTRV